LTTRYSVSSTLANEGRRDTGLRRVTELLVLAPVLLGYRTKGLGALGIRAGISACRSRYMKRQMMVSSGVHGMLSRLWSCWLFLIKA
jgi:hypothetical protein